MNKVEDNLIDEFTSEEDFWSPSSFVTSIDNALGKFTKEGKITEMEQDALRHYFGTRKLAKEYGGTPAYIMGVLNEGLDIFGSGSKQSSVDLHNNNIALKHIEESKGFDFHEGISALELRHILNDLEIPPDWREHYEAGIK